MWLSVFVLLCMLGCLAYRRARLLWWALAIGLWLLPLWGWQPAVFLVYLGLAVMFNLAPVRLCLLTNPLFRLFRKMLPVMSASEQQALDAGTVWWDRELFSGKPDWQRLLDLPAAVLTPEEQAFLDGPTEQLCGMLNDWDITHRLMDLPPEVWQFSRQNRFFGLVSSKQYGGLGFSSLAHARVVTKIASRCGSAAVTVMVPNSLGPGELLQQYGTDEQKQYYLPRLANGSEIPCFALTSPHAGSDAGSIPDYAVVCRADYTDPRTGIGHQNALGLRVSWEKRWITLAPVATVLGLAFHVYDPDHLLGEQRDLGMTCALVPADYPGVQIGRRHYPGGMMFMNGPTWGREVFIPLDWVIGGRDHLGQGWRMLVECLAVGRCISLPAMAVASGKLAAHVTGAYARIREQFGQPIGRFEGVAEALARIAGHTYQMAAAQDLALTGLDLGEKPAVLSAIVKYHNTERMRKVLNDAMDVHGGRAVVLGPRNYLARAYQAIPIAITVEGANILTRTMIIYGQGAIRCHPYVPDEIRAVARNDPAAFDRAFLAHAGFVISNQVRACWLGLTGARLIPVPRAGRQAAYYRQLTRLSAAFALLSDMAMLSLGGSLKRREALSARLGDMLSGLYIASAALRRFEQQGARGEDWPLLAWSVESALYDTQQAMDGLLCNLPNRLLAWGLRRIVFPWGLTMRPPSDLLARQLAQLLTTPCSARARLIDGVYLPGQEDDPVGVLALALEAVVATESLEQGLRRRQRAGQFSALTAATRLDEALAQGWVTAEEFSAISRARKLRRDVIMVDDFDRQLDRHDPDLLQRHVF
jgi:acyl-CoA dehydrogenase